jgi:hypothetical protein
VYLTNGVAQLLVETTTLSMSDSERKAQASFRSLSWQLHQLEWQYSVRISGSLGSAQFSSPEEIARWLQDIDKAAHSTAQDGISRPVPGPNEGQLTIFRPTEATAGESWEVVGAPVEARIIDRLIAKLRYKNKQAEGSSSPIWVRLDEYAGLWMATRHQNMTLTETFNALTGLLQEPLASFSNLAGVILSPAILWAGNALPETLSERIESDGGFAVRSPIPGHRVRESMIVAQAGQSYKQAAIFAGWYEQEATWLDWALERLGHPPFNALVREP